MLSIWCRVTEYATEWDEQTSGYGGVRLAHTRWRGTLWGILLGILYVVAGGYLLLNPVAGLAALTLVLAVYCLETTCIARKGGAESEYFVADMIPCFIIGWVIGSKSDSHTMTVCLG